METNLTSNKSLLDWLDEKVELLKPSNIVWIDGSKEQIDALKKEAVETGDASARKGQIRARRKQR